MMEDGGGEALIIPLREAGRAIAGLRAGRPRTLAVRLAGGDDVAAVVARVEREPQVVLAEPQLDGDDVDAIVQVGTNLSMIRLAAAAELFLGKPVIAINTATYWHALRAQGLQDKKAGFGSLMECH